jgi:hypothetical protein
VAGNASVLETAWTAVAVAGTGVAVAFLVVIWLSYRAVMSWIRQGLAVAWGPRHLFVVSFLVGIGLLLLVWLGFDALGANAMLNPPPLEEIAADASLPEEARAVAALALDDLGRVMARVHAFHMSVKRLEPRL